MVVWLSAWMAVAAADAQGCFENLDLTQPAVSSAAVQKCVALLQTQSAVTELEKRVARLEEALDMQPVPQQVPARLQVWSDKEVRVFHNGDEIDLSRPIRLVHGEGLLVFGEGRSQEDPYQIKIRYRAINNDVVFRIDSTPWTVVRGPDQMGLGSTPIHRVPGAQSAEFSFNNPKTQTPMRVRLRFVGEQPLDPGLELVPIPAGPSSL